MRFSSFALGRLLKINSHTVNSTSCRRRNWVDHGDARVTCACPHPECGGCEVGQPEDQIEDVNFEHMMCSEWSQRLGTRTRKRHVQRGELHSKEERSPWFTRRAIRHWLHNVMQDEPNREWNIDDYDGEPTYQERQLMLPDGCKQDEELIAEEYQDHRARLIECDDEIDELVKAKGGNESDGGWRSHMDRVMDVLKIGGARSSWTEYREASRRRMVNTCADADRTQECGEECRSTTTGMSASDSKDPINTPRDTTTIGNTQQHGHREDSKHRMGHTYDEIEDARGWKWRREDPVDVIKIFWDKAQKIEEQLEQMRVHCHASAGAPTAQEPREEKPSTTTKIRTMAKARNWYAT